MWWPLNGLFLAFLRYGFPVATLGSWDGPSRVRIAQTYSQPGCPPAPWELHEQRSRNLGTRETYSSVPGNHTDAEPSWTCVVTQRLRR